MSKTKFVDGLGVVGKPNADLSNDKLGDIEADKDNGKVLLHNGTTSSPIVTEEQPADITNKTLLEVDNVRIDGSEAKTVDGTALELPNTEFTGPYGPLVEASSATGSAAQVTYTHPFVRLGDSGLTGIVGIAAPASEASYFTMINLTGNAVGLHHLSGSAGTSIYLPTQVVTTLPFGHTASFMYDGTSNLWRLLSITSNRTESGSITINNNQFVADPITGFDISALYTAFTADIFVTRDDGVTCLTENIHISGNYNSLAGTWTVGGETSFGDDCGIDFEMVAGATSRLNYTTTDIPGSTNTIRFSLVRL